MPLFAGLTAKEGGIQGIDWEKGFRMAYAKSKVGFAAEGTGEQIFAIPGPSSRVVLVDDLKTPIPVLSRALCIVLETSERNYQHLYAFDKVLTGVERRHIQRALVHQFGGDDGALGGYQPHRIPGSVNYKEGRNQWVCRLLGNVVELDGGHPLKAREWLGDFSAEASTDTCQNKSAQSALKLASAPAARRKQRGPGEVDESALDWHFSIRKIAKFKSDGLHGQKLKDCILSELISRSTPRRGRDAIRYSSTTVENLVKHGHL